MKKTSVKSIIVSILMFIVFVLFNTNVYAASVMGTINSLNTEVSSSKITNQIKYSRPAVSGTLKNGFTKLSKNSGVYCLDHKKSLKASTSLTGYKNVNSETNKIRYALAVQVPSKAKKYDYKKSYIQNFIWKYAQTYYSAKLSYLNLSAFSGRTEWKSSAQTEMLETLKKANNDYITNANAIENPVKSKITSSNAKYKITDDYLYAGKFKMNAYTLAYSENCGKVNRYSQSHYNAYGTVGKFTSRAGVLAGIVNATVTIKYYDGTETKTLTYLKSDGTKDFAFAYGSLTFEDGTVTGKHADKNYKLFPCPEDEFFLKIDKKYISGKTKVKITLKFEYIQVKAGQIKDAGLYKSNSSIQPLLLTSASLTTSKWISSTAFVIATPINTKINTYISKVEGGGTKYNNLEAKKYEYSGKVQYRKKADSNSRYKIAKGSRASWKTATKKDKRAVVEKGDTVTFTVEIKNEYAKSIYVDAVYLNGCVTKGVDNVSIQSDDGNISQKIYSNEIKFDKLKNTKIVKGGTYKFYVTVHNVQTTNDLYLKATLGNIKDYNGNIVYKSKTLESAKDYFVYKKYYVTVDKFIYGVSSPLQSSSTEEDFESSDDENDNDPDDNVIIEGNTPDNDGTDNSNGTEIPSQEFSDKIRIQNVSNYSEMLPMMEDGEDTSEIWGDAEIPEQEVYYKVFSYDDSTEVVCYFKDGKYYYYEPTQRSITEITNYIYNANGETYYYIDEVLSVIQTELVSDDTQESQVLDVSDLFANDEDISNSLKVYLPVDSSGKIIHSSNGQDQYYYAVQDNSGNIICYYYDRNVTYYNGNNEIDKDTIYYTYDDETKMYTPVLVKHDNNGYYINMQVDSNKAYLQTDTNGNIIHSNVIENKYFYSVNDTNGDPVLYYHQGITGRDNTTYFVYDEVSEIYDWVTVKKDAFGWYFLDSDVNSSQDRTYLEVDNTGNVVYGNANSEGYSIVKNQTGLEQVCYLKNGQYFASDDEIYYKPIQCTKDNGGWYILDSDLVIDEQVNDEEMEEESIDEGIYERSKVSDEEKKNNPVTVSDGDTVNYQIVLYNTKNNTVNTGWELSSSGQKGRSYASYYKPGDVFVNVNDELPVKYIDNISKITCYMVSNVNGNGVASSKEVNVSNGKFSLDKVYVPAGSYTIIKYSITVNKSSNEDDIGENKATIKDVINGNGINVNNRNNARGAVNGKKDYHQSASDYLGISKDLPTATANKVFIQKVEHSVQDDITQHTADVTFQGKGNGVYAEYGDKVKFGINVKNTYTPKSSDTIPFTPFEMEYYQNYTGIATANIWVKVELPDQIYQESGKYKILIDGVEYDIKPKDKKELMINFSSKASVSEVQIDKSYDYSYVHNTGSHDDHCSGHTYGTHRVNKKKVTKVTFSLDTTRYIEVINVDNTRQSMENLKAYICKIDYQYSSGVLYAPTTFSHVTECVPDCTCPSYTCHHYKYVPAEYDKDGKLISGGHYEHSGCHWVEIKHEHDYWCSNSCPYDRGGSQNYFSYTYDYKYTGTKENGEICESTGVKQFDAKGEYIGEAYYIINDYALQIDQYISSYDAQMETYNRAQGYENNYTQFYGNLNRKNYANDALGVEKYETFWIATVATNVATGENEFNASSGGKYATRVRPHQIQQTLDSGLEFTGNTSVTRSGYYASISSRAIVYTVGSNFEGTLLSPGESTVFYAEVRVTESNMSLTKIMTKGTATQLSNVNHYRKMNRYDNEFNLSNTNARPSRIVYPPTINNRATQKTDYAYVKLKDLIIAGSVWLDKNRNGYSDDGNGKGGIKVNLYRISGNQGIRVKSVYTRDDGLYTFDRVTKGSGSTWYQYYVEFEYDGIKYKATEIYGGINTGVSNGTNNLKVNGSYDTTWRLGKGTLPVGPRIGNQKYMTDSNAYELDSERNTFDAIHQTIGYNHSYSGGADLSYTKSDHISTLNEGSNRVMTAKSFVVQDCNKTTGMSFDNINLLYLMGYGGYSNSYPETEYLKFINLGLVERERVDLSLQADVYSVKNIINGEEMTYNINDNSSDSNPYFKDAAYNLSVYDSDYTYRYNENYDDSAVISYKGSGSNNTGELNEIGQSELTTQVTYKIKVKNNKNIEDESTLIANHKDIPIQAKVDEIAVYYDSRYMTPIGYNVASVNNLYATVKDKNTDTGLLENKTNPAISSKEATLRDISSYSYSQICNSNNLKDYGYSVVYAKLTDSNYMNEGEEKEFYITFTVDKDKANNRNLKLGDNLSIIAEISAFTTRYADDYWNTGLRGQLAALVDIDSNPGNVGLINGINNIDIREINNPVYYEDDTYRVGISFSLLSGRSFEDAIAGSGDDPNNNNSRFISGIVWDDARSNKVGTSETGIQYVGNGIYDITNTNISGANTNNVNNPNVTIDKPVSGVKVSLWEIVQIGKGEDAAYYEVQAKNSKGKEISAITDENGQYTLCDYIPGYYKVRFDYGWNKDREDNLIYNGQDYKSTTYYNNNYYASGWDSNDNIGTPGNNGYYDGVKGSLNESNKSDAQDDEIRRLNVNSYSETMTTSQAQVFSEIKNFNVRLVKNTHMYADSTTFYAKPEEVSSATTNINTSVSDFNKTRLYQINNFDFGLEYRPEAEINLDKNISTLELITSDGKTLIKLYFEDKLDEKGVVIRQINEEKSIGEENVQFLPNSENNEQGFVRGFVYINMDPEILEGCTVNIEYEIDTTNESEVDRINKNLEAIAYEAEAEKLGYGISIYGNLMVYTGNNPINSGIDDDLNYNANATAAELLAKFYYEYNDDKTYFNKDTGEDTYKYLKKLKKSYNSSDNTVCPTDSEDINLKGTGYYGMYLGETYYTGTVGKNDTVAKLKVDNVLDYLDNDLTFSSLDNAQDNRTWSAKTSAELSSVIDWFKVNVEQDEDGNYLYYKKGEDEAFELKNRWSERDWTGKIDECNKNGEDGENIAKDMMTVRKSIVYGNLVDEKGVRYDTESRSNLLLSLDTNKSGENTTTGNYLMSKFLKTTKETADDDATTGKITLLASKVLSPDDLEKGTGLDYNNLAEIVQYRTLTGRRTKLPESGGDVIADTNTYYIIGSDRGEDDTINYAGSNRGQSTGLSETITISPPTGLITKND